MFWRLRRRLGSPFLSKVQNVRCVVASHRDGIIVDVGPVKGPTSVVSSESYLLGDLDVAKCVPRIDVPSE